MTLTTPDLPIVFLGLGNPTEQYAGNRHNVGAQCVALFARKHGLKIDTTWPNVRVGEGWVDGYHVLVARPRTFMNESGLAAATLLRRAGIKPDRLVVLCDELDLPQGRLRLRERGSTAGHRGLSSIEREIHTSDFPRLRIGIGRPYPQDERSRMGKEEYEQGIIRWVLSNFTPDEERVMGPVRERAAKAMYAILADGMERAMNSYNVVGRDTT